MLRSLGFSGPYIKPNSGRTPDKGTYQNLVGFVMEAAKRVNLGALIIRIGFGVYYTITRHRKRM